MMNDPALSMLDEPFAGVNPTLEQPLLAPMEERLAADQTILLTDHEMAIGDLGGADRP